jgi:prepilin-type N-terminal cleavage/methylation domain-containing protein
MSRRRGFTLIELLVVLAIVALLASLAAPRYLASLENARETALRTSLAALRDAIDQYTADRGRHPEQIDELVQQRYLRELPEDPFTGRRDSWVAIAPAPDALHPSGLADVRSGAAGRARDGSLYADW